MVWSAKYLTGNKLIDDDHKMIFDMARDIIDQKFVSRGEKITKVMTFLSDYTRQHFRREEQLMRDCDYPDIDTHNKQHEAFIGIITALQSKLSADGDSLDMSLEINDSLVAWLVDHVLGSDKQLAKYYREWVRKET